MKRTIEHGFSRLVCAISAVQTTSVREGVTSTVIPTLLRGVFEGTLSKGDDGYRLLDGNLYLENSEDSSRKATLHFHSDYLRGTLILGDGSANADFCFIGVQRLPAPSLGPTKPIGDDYSTHRSKSIVGTLRLNVDTPDPRSKGPWLLTGSISILGAVDLSGATSIQASATGTGWLFADQYLAVDASGNYKGERYLQLQPVFLKDPRNGVETGESWTRLLDGAEAVWTSGARIVLRRSETPICIAEDDISEKEFRYSFDKLNSNPRTVLVYFIPTEVDTGGGYTDGDDTSWEVAIFECADTSDYLLGHELGHVLHGLHPCDSEEDHWEGEIDTVMDPPASLEDPIDPSLGSARKEAWKHAWTEVRLRCL